MNNQDMSDALKELLLANGMSENLLGSLAAHGKKLMDAIGLTEENLAASIRATNRSGKADSHALGSKDEKHDRLLSMDDNELVTTLGFELDQKSQDDEKLSDVEATVLTLTLLDMEVMNGGLCQFIVNPSGRFLQQVPAALRAVGADAYADAFCHFTEENNLDLQELSVYWERGTDADFSSFYSLLEKYPFSDFDNRYVELYQGHPLETKIAAYIRQHGAEFDLN